MVKKLRCTVENADWIGKCQPCDGDVGVGIFIDGTSDNIFLTPADARKLRKQIKKALEAIEGVNEEEDEGDWFKHGNVFEIIDNSNGHGFSIGAKVEFKNEETEINKDKDGVVWAWCVSATGRGQWCVRKTDCQPA